MKSNITVEPVTFKADRLLRIKFTRSKTDNYTGWTTNFNINYPRSTVNSTFAYKTILL